MILTRHPESHVSDLELALLADNELDPERSAEAAAHLAQCWLCQARKQNIENAIADFLRLHCGTLDGRLPRAGLCARC